MKLGVFGAGGIGGYFGGRLAQAGADVYLVARGDHLDALRADGLRVESIHGDFSVDLPATDDPATIGACDYVLFCVKSYDTEAAGATLEPLLHEHTGVVSLQNGVGNEEKLQRIIGPDHVLGGVAYIFSTVSEPGVIAHTGGPARIIYGEIGRENGRRAERFHEIGKNATMEIVLSNDIESDIWEKLGFICAQAGMTAAVRLPIGNIRETPVAWQMFRYIIEEVYAVAGGAGINLPDSIVDEKMEFAEGLPYDTYSSLHYDMTSGNRMELEALCGEVIRLGHEHDVPVSRCEMIYSILKPWSERNNGTTNETDHL